jgi:hypothetical protein
MPNNPNATQNLKPYQPGQSGNPLGRPRGIKNWSTVIQQLLADEELVDNVIKSKPSWWSSLPNKNAASAITVAMIVKAMSGDYRAAEWLRKTGFGDKLDVTAEDRVEVVHIFKPEKLSIDELNAEGDRLRQAAQQAVSADLTA